MNKSSLSDPSLVERVYQYLYDNRGDLAKPVALVIASADKIESCDAVQQALKGILPNSHVISNYVTIDASTGAIDRWQILALSPNQTCDASSNNSSKRKCPAAFPLCSSLNVCGRLFEGTKDGLKGALGHVLAQVPASNKKQLSAALIETDRDPLQEVQYRCKQIYASTRTLVDDLLRENVSAKNETGPADPAKPTNSTCATCDSNVDSLLAIRNAKRAAVQKKQQYYAIIGLALLFLVLTLIAVLVSTRQSYAKRTAQREEQKINALYQDMQERKMYNRALESISSDPSPALRR